MITVDLNKPAYWVISGKTHTISGSFHHSLATALDAAIALARKENSEALIVQGLVIAVPEIVVKSWPA